jgi:hypothetical protein
MDYPWYNSCPILFYYEGLVLVQGMYLLYLLWGTNVNPVLVIVRCEFAYWIVFDHHQKSFEKELIE